MLEAASGTDTDLLLSRSRFPQRGARNRRQEIVLRVTGIDKQAQFSFGDRDSQVVCASRASFRLVIGPPCCAGRLASPTRANVCASRANQPTVSQDRAKGTTPSREISPTLGRKPNRPRKFAGTRTEPPVSVPSAKINRGCQTTWHTDDRSTELLATIYLTDEFWRYSCRNDRPTRLLPF